MSRSYHRKPRKYYNKDSKEDRYWYYKKYKTAVKRALLKGDPAPVFKKTSGWLTW